MFSSWLSSWYKQSQLQEPFNDQYEVEDDEDWIKVKTTNERQPQIITDERPVNGQGAVVASPKEDVIIKSEQGESEQDSNVAEKKLSRQERRAQLRLATKEKKRQARNTAKSLGRATTCLLSTGPLSIEH
jgi:hypothetical protein